jgi:hypothetical protein
MSVCPTLTWLLRSMLGLSVHRFSLHWCATRTMQLQWVYRLQPRKLSVEQRHGVPCPQTEQ